MRSLTEAALPKLIGIVVAILGLCLLRVSPGPLGQRADRSPVGEMAEMADVQVATRLRRRGLQPRSPARIASFNRLSHSLSSARAETDAAVVGAIRALAAALDARDAYTAGHSERVSAISVAIGRQMQVSDSEIEVLRLGALLHDIGKIGISDNILGKAGVTDDEYESSIEPRAGAQVLRRSRSRAAPAYRELHTSSRTGSAIRTASRASRFRCWPASSTSPTPSTR